LQALKTDYLANPRFWAPFIIAGDGGVGPLDQNSDPGAVDNEIKVEWEDSTNGDNSTLVGIVKSPAGDIFYTLGVSKPAAGQARAGSYIAKVLRSRSLEIINRNIDLAASNIASVNGKLSLLGFLSRTQTSSIARFIVFDENNTEYWHFDEGSNANWNFPMNIIKISQGYALISVESNASVAEGNAIIINIVSDSGALLLRQRYPFSVMFPSNAIQDAILDGRGRLLVAVTGNVPVSASTATKMWTNHETGSKRFCLSGKRTVLLSIDPTSTAASKQTDIDDTYIAALKVLDGKVYAASNYVSDCKISTSGRVSELDEELNLKTIYETNSLYGLEIHDFAVTPSQLILVGSVQSVAPTAVTVETKTAEQIRNYVSPDSWGDAVWELTEEHRNAFILVVARDGVALADRFFGDLRGRSLTRLAADSGQRFMAVGNSFGERGWVLDFSLGRQRSRTSQGLPQAR
jgi:hypothetical protein